MGYRLRRDVLHEGVVSRCDDTTYLDCVCGGGGLEGGYCMPNIKWLVEMAFASGEVGESERTYETDNGDT